MSEIVKIMEPPRKRMKFCDPPDSADQLTSASSLLINDLPNEILHLIFNNLFSGNDSEALKLVLVCKRWKSLVEAVHTFRTLNFFNQRRFSAEHKILWKSKRRYQKLKISSISTSAYLNLRWIQNILNKPELNSREVEIVVGGNGNAEINPKPYSYNKFHKILSSIQTANSLTLNFHRFDFKVTKKTDEFLPIEFPALTKLQILWEDGKKEIAKSLLSIMRTPKLEIFKIDLMNSYGNTELPLFWKFLKDNNFKDLQQLYLWSENTYGFHWKADSLYIWHNEVLRNWLDDFLTSNRLSNLKKFNVQHMVDRDFITRVFREAKRLTHYETNVDNDVFYRKRVYPNIQILTLWNFDGDCQKMMEIHSTFPNVEIIHFAFSELSEEIKTYIWSAFGSLKRIYLLDPTTKNFYIDS